MLNAWLNIICKLYWREIWTLNGSTWITGSTLDNKALKYPVRGKYESEEICSARIKRLWELHGQKQVVGSNVPGERDFASSIPYITLSQSQSRLRHMKWFCLNVPQICGQDRRRGYTEHINLGASFSNSGAISALSFYRKGAFLWEPTTYDNRIIITYRWIANPVRSCLVLEIY